MLRRRKYPKTMMKPHPITVLLSNQTRDTLLSAVDDAVGVEPGPSDIISIRRMLPEDLLESANVFIDIVLGTRKARKLGKAHPGWWYTVKGAEQATHPTIAAYRAERFERCAHVVEGCTGVGMDTVALAKKATYVTTFESDPITAALALGNLRASNVGNVEVRTEALEIQSSLPLFDGLWADPSRRRPDGRRTSGTKEYSPLLETLDAIGKRSSGAIVGIKCGPGDDMPAWLTDAYASEFIGFGSECRERVLWKNAGVPRLSVSLPALDKEWVPNAFSGTLAPSDADDDVLVEPHAAIIASGLVGEFFEAHNLRPIHPKIAYGVGRRSEMNLAALRDWADVFTVVRADGGVSLRRIQQHLRDLRWNNRTEFKKRGWNGEPEDLRRNLSFADSDVFGVVVIARTESGHLTLYCKR